MPRTSNASGVIAQAAAQRASVGGLHALTIGGLATQTGMSKGGVCAHFASKRALQLGAVREAEALFQRAVFGPVQDASAGLPQLRAMTDAWFAYLEARTFEGGCFFTNALLVSDGTGDATVKRAVQVAYARYVSWIERTATTAVMLRHLKPETDARAFAFGLHGIQMATLLWRALNRENMAIALGREQIRLHFAAAASG